MAAPSCRDFELSEGFALKDAIFVCVGLERYISFHWDEVWR